MTAIPAPIKTRRDSRGALHQETGQDQDSYPPDTGGCRVTVWPSDGR